MAREEVDDVGSGEPWWVTPQSAQGRISIRIAERVAEDVFRTPFAVFSKRECCLQMGSSYLV
jgi:hypothetical protein